MEKARETETKEKGKGEGPGGSCEAQSEMAGQRWQESCDMRSAVLSWGEFPKAETFGHAVVHAFYIPRPSQLVLCKERANA